MGLFKGRSNRISTSTADSFSTKSASIKSPTSAVSNKSHFRTPAASTTSLPDISLPPAPSPTENPAAYLRSIYAVRQRSRLVLDLAKRNELQHFDVDSSNFAETARYVVSIIKRDYAPDFASIPPHGRWQHFEVGGRPRIDQLLDTWPPSLDAKERCRRLLDLFLVSVLLDAGAGAKWHYRAQDGKSYNRSEGLAVASLEMFTAGLFSTDTRNPCQVDAAALSKLTVDAVARGLQVSETNPLDGLQGRTSLLIRLGDALGNSTYFGQDMRPGNMLDYLLSHSSTRTLGTTTIPVPTLWTVLMDGLGPIWPASRTQLDGISLGDAWPYDAMPTTTGSAVDKIVPFHKLTQWLCYSLMVPMTKLLNIRFAGVELMTGLAEYRNGGLFVDTGLLTLKPDDERRGLELAQSNATAGSEIVPMFRPDDEVIVEWRALTVAYLDQLLVEVNSLLGLTGGQKLSLAQMLEAGSWKGGREIAEVSRPNTKGPPIAILSDGTVF